VVFRLLEVVHRGLPRLRRCPFLDLGGDGLIWLCMSGSLRNY
jgi:hypothetical protein